MSERKKAHPGYAELLRHWRTAWQMTQVELSRKAGISISTIQKLEMGQRTPGQLTLLRLGQVFGPVFIREALRVTEETLQEDR